MILVEAAAAKINLALYVRRRRDDGYHDLETVFAFTRFGDTLEFGSSDELTLTVTGPWAAEVGEGDNLVLRAARSLAQAAGRTPTGALTLDKHIPVAAGLGGGSADAAAALRLLNRAWGLCWPVARLMPLAAELGADVPACLDGRTSFGTGRGESLKPLDLGLVGAPLVLVNPRVAVPTGPVFAAWDRIDRGALAADAWRSGRNDLQPGAMTIAPVIVEVLNALEASDADLVRMSGSGATCFALFASELQATAAANSLQAQHPGWWSMATTLI